jgi:hypothetical protein
MSFTTDRVRHLRPYPLVAVGLAFLAALGIGLGACEKTGGDVVDSSLIVPYQSRAVVLPDSVDTDSINVGPQRLPDDLLPITIYAESYFTIDLLPTNVSAKVISTDGSSTIASAEMVLTGPVHPIWGQKYAAVFSVSIRRTVVGKLQVEFVGNTLGGASSNAIRTPVTILRLNQPPVLSNLQAPDSVALESIQQFLLLQVEARDPNGQNDIRSVYFNSTRPNGTPSSGNPFAMYDDGTNGDLQANDSTYSLMVVLPPSTTPGTYRFDFQAIDRSDSLSNTITHFVTVKQ